jgi:CIC family chloride channel protein
MESVRVKDVMVTKHTTVNYNVPVASLAGLFLQTNQHAFVVLNNAGKLYGIVSLNDYRRASESDTPLEQITVKDIATRALVTTFPDETLRVVLQRMAPRDLSRIPVVSRDDQHHLLGVIRRNDIVRAYQTETARRGSALSHLAGHPPGTRSVQLIVPEETPLASKCLSEIHFPEDFLVIHVQRSGETILPHGDTCLQPKDIVTFLVKEHDASRVEAFWQAIQQSNEN